MVVLFLLMERVNFRNSRSLNLVGEFFSAKSRFVIVMVHGLTGDKHEGGRFDKAARVLNSSGFNVFRFDFSGCGESADDNLTIENQVDDLECAIAYINSRGMNAVALLGLSLGALVCLKVHGDKICTMVLWSPVTHSAQTPEDYYGPEKRKELHVEGVITRICENTLRRKVVIDKKLFDEWKAVNQEEVLSKIKIPVLIVHGNRDLRIPLGDSKEALKYLPSGSKLEIVERADHIFNDHLDTFVNLANSWFKEHLHP